MMSRKDAVNWINVFVTAWKEHDNETILDLFANVKEYYEGPFSKAVSTREEIGMLWDEIKYQDISALDVDLIAIEDGVCAMHWYFDYQDTRDNNRYEMDGTYEIHFNEIGQCIYFKQWWVMAY